MSAADVVFILGIARRSGTNHLLDLVALHPDCARVRGIAEDYLLAHADRLESFVREVSAQWNPAWDPEHRGREGLRERLADACLAFLRSLGDGGPARYLLTKTPSVANLTGIGLFPRSRALVLVRDGRDVVESTVRSFGTDFGAACRKWADGARTVLDAERRGTPFLRVHYEELVADPESAMKGILGYLDLDPAAYDFRAARELPVRGSSGLRAGGGPVHWHPVPREAGFRPVGRWERWSPAEHARFNRIAGDESIRLGYPIREIPRLREWWERGLGAVFRRSCRG